MRGLGVFALIFAEPQLRDLDDYLSAVEQFVTAERDTLVQRVNAAVAAQQLEGDELENHYFAHEDDIHRLASTFPRLVYAGTLLTACALFESSLVDLCRDFDRDAALPKMLTWGAIPARDSGLQRSARFLKANFGIELAQYARWDDLSRCYLVRNCVAHADGDVSLMRADSAAKLNAAVRGLAPLGIRVSELDKLDFGSTFVRAVIGEFRAFWPGLTRACRENADVGPRYWP